ncbi:MAG: class I SAM-dependent methyltransferase [Bdellovibrionaceae bacterium]|nr:class I SAM-dependent methyltransferase [Pseudobdellovibrionaceae bacterium]
MQHFDHEANEWDTEQKIKMMGVLASKVKENIDLSGSYDILDFGCGTGLFGLEFLDQAKSLLGVDVSAGMLKVFDKKTEDLANVKSENCDLTKSSLEKEFDLIVTSMAFHHLKEPLPVLQKLKLMLRKGGRIVIVDLDEEDGDFHPNNKSMGVEHYGFSKDSLAGWGAELHLKFSHRIINEIEKNHKVYGQFMAIYTS